MSFSKIAILLILSISVSGCSFNRTPVEKNDYYIQLNGEPTDARMDEVESFILRQNIQTISGFEVIYDGNNYQRALLLSKRVHDRYGFHVEVKQVKSAGNNIFIIVKNSIQKEGQCYTFKLSDFNWYSSSKSDLEKYMASEVCATNINDKNERVK